MLHGSEYGFNTGQYTGRVRNIAHITPTAVAAYVVSRRRSLARSTTPGFPVGSRFGLDVGSNNGGAVWTRSEARLRRRRS